jgi:pyrimidine-specific ribonucleoside hydrolase
MLVHLDTDLGSNPDDVAALVYLLARDDVELTGVTTVDDPGGQRAGYVGEVLRLAGRADVPVAAGAERSLTSGRPSGRPPSWPGLVPPAPGPVDAALDLLATSVSAGAVVVGIGPATTLALLERRTPNALRTVHLVLMGGWVDRPGPGLPPWGPQDDWNVTCDVAAATEVRAAAGRLTVVPLATTAQVHLRDRDLPRLDAAGPLGRLMAAQAAAYRDAQGRTALARANPGLPNDLTTFLHDPLTAAVAAGWHGVTIEQAHLRTVAGDHGRLARAGPDDPGARSVELAVGVDGPAFAEHWLDTVTRCGRRPGPRERRTGG